MNASERRILAVLWLFQFVNYCDRVLISFVAPDMMRDLHITPDRFGLVMSCFAVGYVIAQFPGGLMADRRGVRLVMIVGPLLWAALTASVALTTGLAALMTLRFCFGLSEGVSNPAVYKLLGDGFRPSQRAWAIAMFATSLAVGPALTGPLIGGLLGFFSWRQLFLVLALPALLVCALNARTLPPRVAQETGEGTAGKSPASPRTSRSLRDRKLWLIACNYLGFACALFGFMSWMPSYLSMARHIDIKAGALLGGLPYASGALGMLVIGRAAKGSRSRVLAYSLACVQLSAGAALMATLMAPTGYGSLAGLSGAAFFLFGCYSLSAPLLLEIAPPGARASYGAVYSIVGQIGSIIAPAVIGLCVARTGSFSVGFIFMTCALVVASICAVVLATLREGGSPIGEIGSVVDT